MWAIILEQAETALSFIVLAIIASLGSIVTALVYRSRDALLDWIVSRTTESQRNTLWRIAQEAYAHAESAGIVEKGQAKLSLAYDYAAKQLSNIGIKVTSTEIKAAIEQACLEQKKPQTPAGNNS